MLTTAPLSQSKLAATLTPVFGQLPTVISDSPILVAHMASLGYDAFTFEQMRGLSPRLLKSVMVLVTDKSAVPPYREWRVVLKNSRVLVFPLLSFDPSLEATLYTLGLLTQSDFAAAVKANETWINILRESDGPLSFSGHGCDFTCEIENDVFVMKPKTEVAIPPGEWESIGSYFEVGMVPEPEEFRPGFVVNGELSIPGVAVAHHRQMRDGLEVMAQQSWNLLTRLRHEGKFPLKMTIEESHVVEVRAGNTDVTRELLELTNRQRELVLSEMAISTNVGLQPHLIDWNINSQLNEGAEGIHVGLGDGLTGAHIDFICPGVGLK